MNAARKIRHPERRFDRDSWLVVAAAVLYIGAGVVLMLFAFRFPSDGWYYEQFFQDSRGPVTVGYLGDEPSPLRPGDVVVAIDGDLVSGPFDAPVRPSAAWRSGGPVRYTVVRDGQTLDLTVNLAVQPTLQRWLRYIQADGLMELLGNLLSLGLAVLAFWLRPRNGCPSDGARLFHVGGAGMDGLCP